jgi:hypothetical protein
MIYSDDLLAVAKRIFCFGTSVEALEFPKRFLTYAMTYASDEDIEILRKYFNDDDFRAALDDPAPGIFDRSSWAKWNEGYNRTPVPPLPKRKFQASIPLLSPISFPPSLETGNVTTQSDRRHQRWMWIDLPLPPSPFALVIRALRSTHQRFQTSCTTPVKTRPVFLQSP